MAKKSKKRTGRNRREIFKKGLKGETHRTVKKHESRRKGFSIISDNDDVRIWRPQTGSHIIDIIPYIVGDNDPERTAGTPAYTFPYYIHRNVGAGNATVICIEAMKQGECPICKHRVELMDRGESKDRWKPLFPKERNLYNVVCYDMNEEAKGVQVWDESEFYSQYHIAGIIKEKGRGGASDREINFADPDRGKSISFEIQAPVSRDDYKKYLGYKFQRRGYKIKDSLLDAAHTLDELITYPTEEEIEEMYWGDKGREDVEPEEDYDEDEESSEEEDDFDDPYELLEQATDLADLKSIVEDFDLEVELPRKIKNKKKMRLTKKKVKEAIEDQWEDEEDEDEEEEKYDPDEIREMGMRELVKLNKKEGLELDSDDYEDEEDFAEAIIEELGFGME